MWPLSGKEIFEIIHDIPCPYNDWNKIKINGILTDSRMINTTGMDSTNGSVVTLPLLFVAIQGEKFDGHAYLKEIFSNGLALALVHRHSSYLNSLDEFHLSRCLVVDDVLHSLQKFACAFRKTFSFPIIAIGGSNGKTTTKEILSSFLSFNGRQITKTQKSENGFLGIPITLLQEKHKKESPPDALVLEIGIDEIGAMERHIQLVRPNVVILTALGPEHLTGFNHWENAVKEELVLFKAPNARRVWQLYDPKIYEYFLKISKNGTYFEDILHDMLVFEKNGHNSQIFLKKNLKIIFWSLEDISSESLIIKIENENQILFHNKISLFGKHNAANFALSFGAALLLSVQPDNILEGFKNFIPPSQRSKISHFPYETILFDDTYNASPSSVVAALNGLNIPEWRFRKKILVLGDMLELGQESKFWHEDLVHNLREFHNAHLCLFGSAMYNCYKLLKKVNGNCLQKQQLMVDWLDADSDPAQFLTTLSPILKGAIILVKGSRGMRLERFVHCVENFFA